MSQVFHFSRKMQLLILARVLSDSPQQPPHSNLSPQLLPDSDIFSDTSDLLRVYLDGLLSASSDLQQPLPLLTAADEISIPWLPNAAFSSYSHFPNPTTQPPLPPAKHLSAVYSAHFLISTAFIRGPIQSQDLSTCHQNTHLLSPQSACYGLEGPQSPRAVQPSPPPSHLDKLRFQAPATRVPFAITRTSPLKEGLESLSLSCTQGRSPVGQEALL